MNSTKPRRNKQRFRRKTNKEIAKAVGELDALPPVQQAAFSTDLSPSSFSPIPLPGPSGWLRTVDERGQTYKSFSRRSFKHGPHGHCDTLEVVPVGRFIESESPPMSALKEFMEAFFYGVKVRFTKPVQIREVATTGCLTEDDQLLCGDAMAYLRKRRQPRDTFASIAITMVDITPGEGWNFVYGQASMSDGVGVFSFNRYGTGAALLKKSCKTMAHEVGHIFGLKHCIYYHCILNGNNGEEYAPLRCCPICLRKLHDACGAFDIIERYTQLGVFYKKHEWKNELEFVDTRIQEVGTRARDIVEHHKGGESKCHGTATMKTTKGARAPRPIRPRRRMGARVHLGTSKQPATPEIVPEVPAQQQRRLDTTVGTVVAPRGAIVRRLAKKNSRMVRKVKHDTKLEIPLPINTLRTSSGTVRVETSNGWITRVSNRGMVVVDI